MHCSRVLFISLLFAVTISSASQLPFRFVDPLGAYTPDDRVRGGEAPSPSYHFKWPIHKVAIIGAGAGGLVSYNEFARLGYETRLFERDSVPGGNWHYTEDEIPMDAPIPNAPSFEADFRPHLPPENVQLPFEETFHDVKENELSEVKRDHRAPKPIWDKLNATGPKTYQEFRELAWPEHVPYDINRSHLQRYVRTFASFLSLNSNDNNPHTSYNTRVERVSKRYNIHDRTREEAGWTLLLRQFIPIGRNSYKIRWWEEDFDAVVVASGRYNAPNTPQIQGLKQWAQLYPHLITHSRQYRHPEEFTNQSVLIIGGSVSGTEIAEELDGIARNVYLSVRSSTESVHTVPRQMHLSRLPRNVSVISEIKYFHTLSDLESGIQSGVIELYNGSSLRGFDRIVLATGYRYSFPFFPQYTNTSLRQNETVPIEAGRPQPLITDGTHIRSLHLDLFYIEEPTIGFVNVNTGIETFLYSEFTASALAKVWAGQAKLPSTKEMWDTHWRRVKVDSADGGYRSGFMAFGAEKQAAMIRYLVGWLNQGAVKYGGHQLNLPSDSRNQITKFWVAAHFPDYHDEGRWQPLGTAAALDGTEFDFKGEKLVEAWSTGRDHW